MFAVKACANYLRALLAQASAVLRAKQLRASQPKVAQRSTQLRPVMRDASHASRISCYASPRNCVMLRTGHVKLSQGSKFRHNTSFKQPIVNPTKRQGLFLFYKNGTNCKPSYGRKNVGLTPRKQ